MSVKPKQRLVRPIERQPMKDWLLDKLNEKEIPGLEWVHKEQKIFRIKWCHGSRHGWSLKDSILFEKWAHHSGRHHDGDHRRWKANFRCALNSLRDVEEVKDMSVSKGQNAFKVYKMLESRKKLDKPKATRQKKSEPVVKRVPDICVQEEVVIEPNMSFEAFSDFDNNMTAGDDDTVAESGSEGYQTDIQDDTSMDWTTEDSISSSSVSTEPEIHTEDEIPSSNINIPNFDKIIPGFYNIEFGKKHLLPRHNSGFMVELLKQQSPLTPILQPFKVPLHEPVPAVSKRNSTKATRNALSLSHTATSLSTAQTKDTANMNALYLSSNLASNTENFITYPETPDGSEASYDSGSGELIELTIYEEEVTDTPITSLENCIVLTHLTTSIPVTSQIEPRNGQEQYNSTGLPIVDFSYRPLTPPST